MLKKANGSDGLLCIRMPFNMLNDSMNPKFLALRAFYNVTQFSSANPDWLDFCD